MGKLIIDNRAELLTDAEALGYVSTVIDNGRNFK